MINPGLAPWALQEYRPFRALCRIGLIPYLLFAVLIIIRCRCSRLLSDLLLGAGVSAALAGLNKCISTINPGLAPWAVQEYRPFRALCGQV